ncbi:hypothetical protein LFL96_25820 [Paraburkholderia sp. D15]|uniref:hypothetical protein n=1 Tax=Paraburkholderia sp. D15 TaxID=2880218 RepID=UPI00247A0DB6|nr:hypothetical protein [Paraburkholderia sp. D15]WGS54434.1 hypothetical protein LFL96_25820 [Paraburkholderia sp. D15]
MSQIRTVKIFDRLPDKPVLREVALNWNGRTEPEPASLIHSSRYISIHFWQREDQQPDLYQDVLLEAENNGLNPGLKKERDAIRAVLKAAEQKTSK